ncbi:MAG: tetratricopeptide repeat protein [Cyclobacteriaceae bacterium]
MRLLLMIFIILLSASAVTAQQRFAEESFRIGLSHYEERSYDSALNYFNEVLRIQPLRYEAYKLRANSRAMNNDLEGALLDYRIYLEKYPDDADALFSYSEISYRQQHYKQAIEGFLKLKTMPAGSTSRIYYTLRPGDRGVSNMFTTQSEDKSLLDNYLGLAFTGLGEYGKSIAHFDSALSVRPVNADYITNKGLAYLAMERQDLAKAQFRKALDINPDHALAKQQLAYVIREEGDQDAAIRLYNEEIAARPESAGGYENRGYAHLLKGDNSRAIADFDAAIRRNPKEPSTWLNRGIALMRLDLLEEAFSDLSKAIELDPSLASAYMNRGNILYRLGEYKNALNDYNVAIIYDKAYFLAYYHRGITQYKLGDKDAACVSLRFAAVNGIEIAAKTFRKICNN